MYNLLIFAILEIILVIAISVAISKYYKYNTTLSIVYGLVIYYAISYAVYKYSIYSYGGCGCS
jgi:hypothetical protein